MSTRKNYGHARAAGVYVDINDQTLDVVKGAVVIHRLRIVIVGDSFSYNDVTAIRDNLNQWIKDHPPTKKVDSTP
jgi:hypothetical protein